MEGTPIIIKKKKAHGHAHHGGSWKVAYADFVTAMMAFFMVMWIMGLSDQTRAQIQGYFNDPFAPIKSEPKSKTVIDVKGMPTSKPGEKSAGMDSPYDREHSAMQKLKSDIEKVLKSNPEMAPYLKHMDIVITKDGLRLEFKEDHDFFFESGSATLKPEAMGVIKMLAKKLAESGRVMGIEGHTDSVPFKGDPYGNILLSSQRAGSLADALGKGGVAPDKIRYATGFGDNQLRDPQHPTSGVNRRVSILLPFTTPLTATTPMPRDEVAAGMKGSVHPKVNIRPAAPNLTNPNK